MDECGIYDRPVLSEGAVHNLERDAIWITYQPSLPKAELDELYAFSGRQTVLDPQGAGSSRYVDITPYPGLPSPVVATRGASSCGSPRRPTRGCSSS